MSTIIVNFKTYKKATGQEAVKLAKICEEVSKKTGVQIVVAVQDTDIFHVSSSVSIPVFAEHIDPIMYGANTGKILPECLVDNGATGVLINHSEDKEEFLDIEKSIKRAKEVGLKTVICAPSAIASEAVSTFNPDFVAMEPPELIGGDISVSVAKPELITDTVNKVRAVNKHVPILCGAGIKNQNDVKIALKLGCEGILVASGITKAKDPHASLLDLAEGFK